jgi:DNA polymerase-4
MHKQIIFHIDANSAYLSWEAVHRLQHGDSLDLRTIPSVVGGDQASRRGIVLAKSIPAKKYNIRTGESLFEARNKCPHLFIAPPNYALYMQCSSALGNILREYSPVIDQYSIEEYFPGILLIWRSSIGPPMKLLIQLENRIKKRAGFYCEYRHIC